MPLFTNILPFVSYYLSSIQTSKLFTNLTGGDNYMTNQSYKWMIKKIIDKIKLKAIELNIDFNPTDFTPYIFRHTYATLLYYSGVRLKDAEYYMGHSDSKMLSQVYIHLDKKQLRENNIIENFVQNKLKNNRNDMLKRLLSNE